MGVQESADRLNRFAVAELGPMSVSGRPITGWSGPIRPSRRIARRLPIDVRDPSPGSPQQAFQRDSAPRSPPPGWPDGDSLPKYIISPSPGHHHGYGA